MKELLYFEEQKTWVEARNVCRNLGGKLMRSTTLNRNIIENCVEIDPAQRFWVGEHRTLSAWFEITGKYSMQLLHGDIIIGRGGVRKSLWLRAFLIMIFYLHVYDRTMGVHGKKEGWFFWLIIICHECMTH